MLGHHQTLQLCLLRGSKRRIWPHLRDSFESCSELPGGARAGGDSPAAGTQGGCKDVSVTINPACTQTIRNCIYLEKYFVIVHLELPRPRLEQPPGRECRVRQSVGYFHIPKGLLPMPTLCLASCPLSLPWEDSFLCTDREKKLIKFPFVSLHNK